MRQALVGSATQTSALHAIWCLPTDIHAVDSHGWYRHAAPPVNVTEGPNASKVHVVHAATASHLDKQAAYPDLSLPVQHVLTAFTGMTVPCFAHSTQPPSAHPPTQHQQACSDACNKPRQRGTAVGGSASYSLTAALEQVQCCAWSRCRTHSRCPRHTQVSQVSTDMLCCRRGAEQTPASRATQHGRANQQHAGRLAHSTSANLHQGYSTHTSQSRAVHLPTKL